MVVDLFFDDGFRSRKHTEGYQGVPSRIMGMKARASGRRGHQ
jgi:hypothetical protein